MNPEEFAAVPHKKRVVKKSTLIVQKEPVSITTMWDGVDNSEGKAPKPLPFSTFVHSESFQDMMLSVPTEKHAHVSHELALGFVRAQGGKGGWRIPVYFLARAWGHHHTVKQGWFTVILTAFVVAVQLSVLTASAITWDWGWSDLFPLVSGVLYAWLLKHSIVGLRRKLRERGEERRANKERTEFENIIGPLR